MQQWGGYVVDNVGYVFSSTGSTMSSAMPRVCWNVALKQWHATSACCTPPQRGALAGGLVMRGLQFKTKAGFCHVCTFLPGIACQWSQRLGFQIQKHADGLDALWFQLSHPQLPAPPTIGAPEKEN